MIEGVDVIYKCACMPKEETVRVPYRREDEEVDDWMKDCLGGALYLDHRARSPDCRRTAMEYAKMAAPENSPGIGRKPVVNG